jgi:ribosome-associated toxin RatA of RatAB toxin-antitoxin module
MSVVLVTQTEVSLQRLVRRYVTELFRTTDKASISPPVIARVKLEYSVIEEYFKTRVQRKVD